MKYLVFLLIIISLPISAQVAENNPSKVWVIANYIKENAKADYEKWMTDIFFKPMNNTKDPLLAQQNASTRWLSPARQNPDKTWTYVFLMDPIIPKADYDIENYLQQTYGETQGKTYLKQYESFIASEPQIHVLKNDRIDSAQSNEEAIKKVILNEGIAFSQGNIDAFMDTYKYSPDILWTVTNGMEPGDVLTFRGYDALKSFSQSLPWFKNFKPENSEKVPTDGALRDNWNFQFKGNIAIVNFDEHWINDKAKSKVDLTGIKILERINGQWKIITTSALADFKDATPPIRSKY